MIPSFPAISILLPTRGRPHNVARLLGSIVETASAPECIEMVVYLDEDDASANALHDLDPVSSIRVVGPRRPMGEMFQACYARSRGRLILFAGDDIVFRTPGWDRVLLACADRFVDGIGLIYGNDLLKGEQLCTHPALPRATCELLGRPCPGAYPGEYLDTHVLDTFRKLRAWGVDRIRYLPDVVIEHMHHSVGKAPHDATYAGSAPSNVCRDVFVGLEAQRLRDAQRLRAATGHGGAYIGVADA